MTGRASLSRLWLICIGLLVCMMVLELGSPREQTPSLAAVIQASRTVGAMRPPGRAREYAQIVLSRPLFSIHRRPPADAAHPASTGMAAVPRLSGIIIAARTRRALFEHEGKSLAGSVGEQVGPYAILAITPRQVSVIGPLGLQTLTLGFSSAARAAAAPSGGNLLDQLHNQQFRQPALPSSAAVSRLLLHQSALAPTVSP